MRFFCCCSLDDQPSIIPDPVGIQQHWEASHHHAGFITVAPHRKTPNNWWSNNKGQLTFGEPRCYPLAPPIERSIIPRRNHSTPPIHTCPCWNSEAGAVRLFLGWWSCSSKCPNSESGPLRGIDREAGNGWVLGVPILISFICDSNHITHVHTRARRRSLPNVCHGVDFSIQIRAVLASCSKQIVLLHQKPGHAAATAGWGATWCHGCAGSFPVDKAREWILHKARESCQSSTSRQPQQDVRILWLRVKAKSDDQQKWPQQQNIFFYDALKLSGVSVHVL